MNVRRGKDVKDFEHFQSAISPKVRQQKCLIFLIYSLTRDLSKDDYYLFGYGKQFGSQINVFKYP